MSFLEGSTLNEISSQKSSHEKGLGKIIKDIDKSRTFIEDKNNLKGYIRNKFFSILKLSGLESSVEISNQIKENEAKKIITESKKELELLKQTNLRIKKVLEYRENKIIGKSRKS